MDGQLIQRVLAIVERDLRRRILPELATPASRLQIDYMIRLLQWTAIQVGTHDALCSAHEAALQALLASDEVAHLPAPSVAFYDGQSVPPAADRLRRIAAAAGAHPAPFDRYVDLETALVRALDAEGGSGFGDIYKGGKLAVAEDRTPPSCDAATLSAYLRRRFDAPLACATDIMPLPGGFGKDTILFDLHGCGSLDGPVVIRKDFAVRAGPTPVTAELPLLRAIHRLGVPVAEPLWAEPDETIIGGPFIVSRRVGGSSAATDWQDSVERRRHFIDRFARILAQLHRLTANDLFGEGDVTMRSAVQANIKLFYDHYRSRARAVSGRLEAAFAWLAANLSVTDEAAARLVHGDFGFHNLLMQDGNINALLDWEFAHFGDPAEDIGYCWQFIDQLIRWDDFMAMYVRHGGMPISQRLASYYRVWGDVRNAVMGVGARCTVDLSGEADIRSPSSALAFGPLLELRALGGAAEWNRRYGRTPAAAEEQAA